MLWLKTTVYTVIACTVGIVLLFSVVAIAIFRIKLKRSAVRRAFRQAERRRQHASRCENSHHHGGSRSRRHEHHEHEPFISSPSPTHFGNIIVNVNNGVQYVPTAVVQSPPTYAEVVAETGVVTVGRHSPPPEYSTIDRNPNRLSDIPVSQSYNNNMSESIALAENTSATTSARLPTNSASVHEGCQNDIQLFNSREEALRNQISTSVSTQFDTSGTVTETNSLGRQSCRGQSNRQARNVRTVGSPWRPKQLKVRDGQIVLDESSCSSSDSSSPDTINRNTQTNMADILPTNSENVGKPAQLQVHDGQIILANDSSASGEGAESVLDVEGAMCLQAQGQIEVKDGFIVFRSVGTST